jgi:hypothetical protein
MNFTDTKLRLAFDFTYVTYEPVLLLSNDRFTFNYVEPYMAISRDSST